MKRKENYDENRLKQVHISKILNAENQTETVILITADQSKF